MLAILERETRFNKPFKYVLGNGHADVSPTLFNDPLASLFTAIP